MSGITPSISIGAGVWKRPGYKNFPALCQRGYIGFASDMVAINPTVVIMRVHMNEMWVRTLHETFPLWVGGQKTERQKRMKLEDALNKYQTDPKVEAWWAARSANAVQIAGPSGATEFRDITVALQKAREEEDEDEDLDMDMTERWSHVERDQPFREDGKELFEPMEGGMKRKGKIAEGPFMLPGESSTQMKVTAAMGNVALSASNIDESVQDDDEMDMS